jgi:hypothetical protein
VDFTLIGIDVYSFDEYAQSDFVEIMSSELELVLEQPVAMTILSISAGSVVVHARLEMYSESPTYPSSPFCAFGAVLAQASLVSTLAQANPLFQGVRITLAHSPDCYACTCTIVAAASTSTGWSRLKIADVAVLTVIAVIIVVLIVVLVQRGRRRHTR